MYKYLISQSLRFNNNKSTYLGVPFGARVERFGEELLPDERSGCTTLAGSAGSVIAFS